jgi:lipopolysaccharide export system protein LptA
MKAMKRLALAVGTACLAIAAGAASPALSQQAGSSLRNHNSNAPVDFAAERGEVQERAGRAILSGNVVVRQAQLQLNAERVTVSFVRGSDVEIDRIDASGGVLVRSPSETARGQYAIYDLDARVITLIGGVTLTRGDSEVRGGRLVLDLASGRAVMDGGTGTPRIPGVAAPANGRVTGRFTVPQRGN